MTVHRMYKTSTYRIWSNMKTRCYNSHNPKYKNYGGRGIRVCDRWFSFQNFLQDMGNRPHGLTLERIDVNGDYEPTNCRWATHEEQANNKNSTPLFFHEGKKLSVSQWAREVGLNRTTLRNRLYAGVPLPIALKLKVGERRQECQVGK